MESCSFVLQDSLSASSSGQGSRGRTHAFDLFSSSRFLVWCFAASAFPVAETSGLNLTGEYVGQTKKKVEEQLDASRCR